MSNFIKFINQGQVVPNQEGELKQEDEESHAVSASPAAAMSAAPGLPAQFLGGQGAFFNGQQAVHSPLGQHPGNFRSSN